MMRFLRGVHLCSRIAVNIAAAWVLFVASEVLATVGYGWLFWYL